MLVGQLFRTRVLLLAAFTVIAGCAAASAETLADALSRAYMSNPTLRSERARLRATDEQVPQALSGWRPTINAQGSVSQQWSDNSNTKGYSFNPLSAQITLSQPIFRGFKTIEGTKAAEANVKAEREQVLSVEQNVMFTTIQAYLDVIRDRQILALRQQNVQFLKKQLQASDARFKAGELTRTDVAQSRSSLSGAQASVAVAVANVKSSEANYVNVVGTAPKNLKPPRLAPRPASLDRALATAQESNPSILAAAYVVEAAEHNIEVTRSNLLPSLNLSATARYDQDPQKGVAYSHQESIQGVLSVPIYDGGLYYSAVRQAKQTASQNRIQVISATRTVRQNVTNSWNNLIAAKLSLISVGQQLAASKLALDGVRQEYLVGSRTTIDVLNAQQSLLSVQISQVSAQHDQILASYQLLSAMGHLTAENLGLDNIYDPTKNYDAVRGKWIGWGADTVE